MKTDCAYRHRNVYRQLTRAVLATALAAPLSARASWRTWVGEDTALGGSGTWNSTNLNWSASDAGAAPYYAWAAGDKPKFFAPGGAVTVEGTVKLYSEFYLYGDYVFTGGMIGTQVSIAMNVFGVDTRVTINSALSTRTADDPAPVWGNLVINKEGTVVVNSDLTQYNFNGNIVFYNGTLVLNGDNYSQGAVMQNDVGQYGRFYLNGTHYNAGSYTVRENGTLGGTGTVQLANSGKLVNVSGTLTPGTATEIGTLTIAVGDLKFNPTTQAKFQVDLTADKADKVVVGDLLTYNGTLTIDVTGERDSDASYTLFQYGSKSGTFAAVNINGVNPNKAEASFDENTGVFTYHVLPPQGTLITIQ